MSTVIVSFRFLAPHRPAEDIVQAHHALLCRLNGLNHHLALERDSEHAYVLAFDGLSALDRYLASEEYRQYSTQRGCYDVFVKQFDPLPVPAEDILIDDRPPEAVRSAALSA